jgi:hypothetical protein
VKELLSYEEFKGIVREKFKEKLGEGFEDAKVEVSECVKVNRVLDGLTVSGAGGKDFDVRPNLYLNDAYERYQKGEGLEEMIEEMARSYKSALKEGKKYGEFARTVKESKDRIVFQVVNAAQNEELLKRCPHRNYMDLAVIYRVLISCGEHDGMASSVVTNQMAENMGLNEEELYGLAAENTRRLLPAKARPLEDLMREMFRKDGVPDYAIEMLLPPELGASKTTYVLTNEQGVNGACSMLYLEVMADLAEKAGANLFVLPSSTHEVLVMPDVGQDSKELAEMVLSVNKETVALSERLSNQVYAYDREKGLLYQATDTPNKSLVYGAEDRKAMAVAERESYRGGKDAR